MFIKNMSSERKMRGLVMLRNVVQKVQKGIFVMAHRGRTDMGDCDSDGEVDASRMVADDVKEGHFVVFAVRGEKMRFVVDLEFLTDPDFLRLLGEAGEEYGYEQKGALEIPCQPAELQRILEERKEKRIGFRQWIRVNLSNIASLL